ncbi:MAG: hypothetical protein LBT47_14120 [Deltaproteobacteria bacterium]|jgi:hypothetical protein|nr:hypothetical protein [Deltaproteobacteria bacterium]
MEHGRLQKDVEMPFTYLLGVLLAIGQTFQQLRKLLHCPIDVSPSKVITAGHQIHHRMEDSRLKLDHFFGFFFDHLLNI